jgi:L-lactate dehydrogenase complex protein LldE
MKVGLFIPCYVDQFYPNVAIATLQVLEKLGVEVVFPKQQTCCGQPMANSGYEKYSKETYYLFVKKFQEFDYIVAPSGSCVYHIEHHLDVIPQSDEVKNVRNNIYEFCDFLENVLKVKAEDLNASFHHKVGLHYSCHGLRGLHLAKPSETMDKPFSVIEQLLQKVKGIELVELDRRDECCGFGGSFSVVEQDVSIKMGKDRIADHYKNKAEVIASMDVSCLMHMQGIISKQQLPVKVMHVAEILNQK